MEVGDRDIWDLKALTLINTVKKCYDSDAFDVVLALHLDLK